IRSHSYSQRTLVVVDLYDTGQDGPVVGPVGATTGDRQCTIVACLKDTARGDVERPAAEFHCCQHLGVDEVYCPCDVNTLGPTQIKPGSGTSDVKCHLISLNRRQVEDTELRGRSQLEEIDRHARETTKVRAGVNHLP